MRLCQDNLWLIQSLAMVVYMLPHAVHAETLEEAFAYAYTTNPELKQARNRVQQADEQVASASAQQRISITATGQKGFAHNYIERNNSNSPIVNTNPTGTALTVNQPIWTGGRAPAAIARAESVVQQQRAGLQSTEQQLFLVIAEAYLSVLTAQEIVKLQENNVIVMIKHWESAKTQMAAGDATRTDVAQAQSRLAKARSDLKQAEGQAQVAAANYQRHVGRPPQNLHMPDSIIPQVDIDNILPSIDALRKNPLYIATLHAEQSAEHEVDIAYSEMMPSIVLQSQLTYDLQTNYSRASSKSAISLAKLTMPIYQGGAEYSRIRSAEARLSELKLDTDRVQRQIESESANHAATYRTAVQTLQSTSEQVDAAKIALDGVMQERMAGTRTVLDELDAEQELINAKVDFVKAMQSEKIARFYLAAAIGELNLQKLGITSVETYQPENYYQNVRHCVVGCLPSPTTALPTPKESKALPATLLNTQDVRPETFVNAPQILTTKDETRQLPTNSQLKSQKMEEQLINADMPVVWPAFSRYAITAYQVLSTTNKEEKELQQDIDP